MTTALLDAMRAHRLFQQERLLVRAGAFALGYVVAFGLYPLGSNASYAGLFVLGVACAAATVLAIGLIPLAPSAPLVELLPLLGYLASIALLREAHGGVSSGYAALVLIPVVWAALFGRRTVVALVVVAAALTIALPPLVERGASYPAAELRRAIVIFLVAAICAVTIHELVRAVLAAEARLTRARAQDVHDDLVQAFAAAQLALAMGDAKSAGSAVRGGLTAAQTLAAAMFADAEPRGPVPGALRRVRGTAADPQRP